MADEPRLAIICPIGETGQVVPMTINKLLDSWEKEGQMVQEADNRWRVGVYDAVEVIVPYTKVSLEPAKGEGGLSVIEALFAHCFHRRSVTVLIEAQVYYAHTYRWGPSVFGIHPSLIPPRRLVINLHLYMIPIYPKRGGQLDMSEPVDDIDDLEDDEQFQDLIYGLVTLLNSKKYELHLSLAGGRKTMSADQQTGAILFGASAGLSHVLEPSKKLAKGFIDEHQDVLAYNSPDNLQKYAKRSHQPLPELYSRVSLEFINLSEVIEYITHEVMPGNLEAIAQLMKPLQPMSLQKIFAHTTHHAFIYTIGRYYREGLKGINEEVGRRLQQSYLAGLWDSMLRHELNVVGPKGVPGVLANTRNALQDWQPGKALELDELVSELKDAERRLSDFNQVLFAIKVAAGNWRDAAQCVLNGMPLDDVAVESKTIREVLDLAIRIGELADEEEFLARLAARDGVTLVRQDEASDVRVSCFPWVLALAFFQLIKNVQDHGRGKERPVQLTITVSNTEGGVEVTIEDDGPGFPLDLTDLSVIFRPGFSWPSQGLEKKHQGIGLTAVDRIIRAHHGHIKPERGEPRGARFVISLPEAAARQ